jgi:3-deoxy-D-manno-octulosonate 8-phosphate phosphatase (KDO 8-P phosphatase)
LVSLVKHQQGDLSDFPRVKLLALDVDGVLTDGGLYCTESGEEIKKFNVKDGLGLKQLMASGIEVALISASSSQATLHRAKKLGITHVFTGVDDKLATLKTLCQMLKLELRDVAYMGDDRVDIPVLGVVGLPITVADAIAEAKACAVYITEKGGGQGAVREVCDLILGPSFK